MQRQLSACMSSFSSITFHSLNDDIWFECLLGFKLSSIHRIIMLQKRMGHSVVPGSKWFFLCHALSLEQSVFLSCTLVALQSIRSKSVLLLVWVLNSEFSFHSTGCSSHTTETNFQLVTGFFIQFFFSFETISLRKKKRTFDVIWLL